MTNPIAYLKSQLEAKVRWCTDNHKRMLWNSDVNLEFFIDGVPSIDEPEVRVSIERYYAFKIDIYNPAPATADQFMLALLLPERIVFDEPDIQSYAQLADGRYLYNIRHRSYVYPDGWDAVQFIWGLKTKVKELKQRIPIALRVFTATGSRTYTFTIIP